MQATMNPGAADAIRIKSLRDCLGYDPARAAADIDRMTASLLRLRRVIAQWLDEYPMDLVLSIVAADFAVTVGDIKGRSRPESIVWPRHVAATLGMECLGATSTTVAAAIGGRDHTTALNSLTMVRERCDVDRKFAQRVERLRGLVIAAMKNPTFQEVADLSSSSSNNESKGN